MAAPRSPESSDADARVLSFADLALTPPLLKALGDVGYESPSPIQAATIPPLLEGRDLLGQAQTGTGKTAAFALPILARIDLNQGIPQALVLAPTRELAIQVAEAFQKYATHLPGFHVLPIYGGQAYGSQLHALKRGVHVVVGTPGRIIDHLERGSLDLSQLRHLVLDEADEMLRMGFIDDVEKILQKTPASRQTALFSATMPSQIKRIAQTYLRDPAEITIAAKTRTADNIRQRYWLVSGLHKLDALTRILEAESFEGMIIFARTKQATEELAEKLAARGFAAAAINGDIAQPLREKAVPKLTDGQLDILVATDVAARGLDVDRISHVVNYDIPYDTESYVHRIGRTGRAGRSGEAILFVAPRERGMLGAIERATRQKIEPMQLPSVDAVNEKRVAKFLGKIGAALESSDLSVFRELVERYEREHNVPAVEIAAALAQMVQGKTPLLLDEPKYPPARDARPFDREARAPAAGRDGHARDRHAVNRHPRESGGPGTFADRRPDAASMESRVRANDAAGEAAGKAPNRAESIFPDDRPKRARPAERPSANEFPTETFRIEVGHMHGVQPGNIVGAIANEAELDSKYIGRIDIRDDHTLVDLPEGMPREVLEILKKARVAGRPMRIARASEDGGGFPGRRPSGPRSAPPRGAAPRGGAPRGAAPAAHRKGPRKPRNGD
jgi:ATP-dependent RNA helicase DeaD